nr:hypothetical protein CFP56_72056 [Quercus suber]
MKAQLFRIGSGISLPSTMTYDFSSRYPHGTQKCSEQRILLSRGSSMHRATSYYHRLCGSCSAPYPHAPYPLPSLSVSKPAIRIHAIDHHRPPMKRPLPTVLPSHHILPATRMIRDFESRRGGDIALAVRLVVRQKLHIDGGEMVAKESSRE